MNTNQTFSGDLFDSIIHEILNEDDFINETSGSETLASLTIREHSLSESLDFERYRIFKSILKFKNVSSIENIRLKNNFDLDVVMDSLGDDYYTISRNLIASVHEMADTRHLIVYTKDHIPVMVIKHRVFAGTNVLNIVGESSHIDKLLSVINPYKKELDEFIRRTDERSAKYRYFFLDDSGVNTSYGAVRSSDRRPNDTFYPWLKNINKTLKEFINDYLASDEAILILLGPPGTGKSTFIKELMLETTYEESVDVDGDEVCGRNIYVTADPLLIAKRPGDIIQKMISDKPVLAVFEDADVLLGRKREKGNWDLSTVLNVTDGLVPTRAIKPKIVFTANITDINKIDEALIRPGRCFAVINFSTLDIDQVQDVLNSLGMEKSFDKEDYTKRYSLAEVVSKKEELKRGTNIIY